MGLHILTSPWLPLSLLAPTPQLQLLQQDRLFPPPQLLTCLFFCLRNPCSHSILLVLSHLLVLSIKSHFLTRWYPNPKCDSPGICLCRTQVFPISSIMFCNYISDATLPTKLQLYQCSDHICVLFILYPGTSTGPNTQNAVNKYF